MVQGYYFSGDLYLKLSSQISQKGISAQSKCFVVIIRNKKRTRLIIFLTLNVFCTIYHIHVFPSHNPYQILPLPYPPDFCSFSTSFLKQKKTKQTKQQTHIDTHKPQKSRNQNKQANSNTTKKKKKKIVKIKQNQTVSPQKIPLSSFCMGQLLLAMRTALKYT